MENLLNFNVEDISFNMIFVEGGSFEMGATDEQFVDPQRYWMEFPVHEVSLDSFYIGETVVTQGLWKALMGFNRTEPENDNHAVDLISWDESQLFCQKLSDITGRKFRLPTEAEWEFAARGGNLTDWYRFAGTDFPENIMSNTVGEVKKHRPNELRIYDMNGLVWQWVSDYWGKYEEGKQVNPKGPTDSDDGLRVTRGGCVGNDPEIFCRVSCRNNYYQNSGVPGLGFRLAMDVQTNNNN